MDLLMCVTDCWQQLLACPLHGAHISADHGFLQPVYVHEWPESSEWRAGACIKTTGRRAAWGKNRHSSRFIHRFLIKYKRPKKKVHSNRSTSWKEADTRQPDYKIITDLLARMCLFMLAGTQSFSFTVVIQHSPFSSALPLFPPSPLMVSMETTGCSNLLLWR